MARSWKPPRKILCATDLTPSSDRALDRAIQLAGEWNASLLVVHIVDDTGLLTKDFSSDVRGAEAQLNRQIKAHPGTSELEVDIMVTLGKPAERRRSSRS